MAGKDSVRKKMALEQAMAREGKRFIKLQLIDMTKNRIQGAIVLKSILTKDVNNLPKYVFSEQGGPINFEFDEFTGVMVANVLDCEHNRNWLASMSAYSYWMIMDKQVEQEIHSIAKKITRRAIRPEAQGLKMADVLSENMSDEDIDAQIEALRKKKKARQMVQETTKDDTTETEELHEPDNEAVPEVPEPDDEDDEEEVVTPEDKAPEPEPELKKTRRGKAKKKTGMVTVEG